jgi:hypothetical protein
MNDNTESKKTTATAAEPSKSESKKGALSLRRETLRSLHLQSGLKTGHTCCFSYSERY